MKVTTGDLYKNIMDKRRDSIIEIIKESFSFLTPVFLIGAFAVAIRSFPVATIRVLIGTVLNGKLYDFLGILYNATYGFMAVYLVFIFSCLDSRTEDVHADIHVISAVSTTICYFGSLGSGILNGEASLMRYTNMANVFSALLTAVLYHKLFFLLYHKLMRNREDAYSTTFTRGIHCVPVICICVCIAVLEAELISLCEGMHNFNDLVVVLLGKPFETIGATFFGGFLIMFCESVLWMVGIHGSNVFDTLLTSESSVFAFGNGNIMNKPLLDTFVLMGGCGTTLCLFAAILLFSQDKRTRRLTKLAGIPLVFNINEILVFGIPIVFNPVYLIPFVATPLVSYIISYRAISTGLVPPIINDSVHWTTPVIISGYQATGSVAGSILQLVILIVGTFIYMPFVRKADAIAVENEKKCLQCLTDICRQAEAEKQPYRLNHVSALLSSFEENLFTKLNSDIQSGTVTIHYQPQVRDGRIIAAEALLRFKYREEDKAVYPPLVVEIARNRGVFEAMSKVICQRALADLKKMQFIDPAFGVEVNLRIELIMDEAFRKWLIEAVEKAQVTPNTFGIEITEDANISDADVYQTAFEQIKKSGIKVFMDDFSMGNTSITILQKNYFDFVKIDGSLIRKLENERTRSIVSSIIQLGQRLNFCVIAEYVETEEQKEMLLAMGCDTFQGYLYYQDMPVENLIGILEKENRDKSGQ